MNSFRNNRIMKYLVPCLLAFCMCLSFMSGATFVAADQNQVTVVADRCVVYQSASFDAPLLINEQTVTFKHGHQLTVLGNEISSPFIQVQGDFENTLVEGFVYRYYVTFASIEIKEYPVFNASVAVENTIIYDLDKQPTEYTATKGQGLYLYNGFNDKETYTAVAVVLSDDSVYYGYVLTKDIKTKGINAGLITGFVVIISCLTIIFLLLFMKKRKQH